MNSSFALILMVFVLIASGCGVKAKPLSPPETAVSSYVESFTGTPLEQKEPQKPSVKK